MGEVTGIEWTDHTFNPWIGCQKVGPACDFCYAWVANARFGGGDAPNWGPHAPRRRTSPANWKNPRRWDRKAAAAGVRRRLFIASHADVFDNAVPRAWRDDLWVEVNALQNIDVQLVTKRVDNVEGMMPAAWREKWPANVWLIITVANQAEADRDIPKLLALKARYGIRVVGLSIEPMLGLINITKYLPHLDWVITGGESGRDRKDVPRYIQPLHPDWVRFLRDMCEQAGVAFFFKQWGEWAVVYDRDRDDPEWRNCPSAKNSKERYVNLAGGHGFHGESVVFMRRVGKKRAGALLDGREHREFPTVAELHQAAA